MVDINILKIITQLKKLYSHLLKNNNINFETVFLFFMVAPRWLIFELDIIINSFTKKNKKKINKKTITNQLQKKLF